MRALLIAELADPEGFSVPLVAWSHAAALRRQCDCLIVTQIRHREVFLRHGLKEGEDFIAIDSEPVARPAWRLGQLLRGGAGKGWTTAMAIKLPGYLYFERLLWKQLGCRIKAGEFDVVHRISPLTPTLPSPVARRCRSAGVPFVLGPLNGGVPWPPGYNEARMKEREWLSFVRDIYKLVPGYGSTRRSAAAVICGSLDTLEQEPPASRRKAFHVPENGIDLDRFTTIREDRAIDVLRIVFVGRLVPYKGCDILLEAVRPFLASGQATLTIVGDGPQRGALESAVAEHGVEDAVDFRGWVQHGEVGALIAASDLFAFPSIREFGGAVAIEAMAAAVPPMVVTYGGLGETVTDDVGFPIPIGSRTELIARFRGAVASILDDTGVITRLGRAGRGRVEELFAWDAKAAQTMRIYRHVIDGEPCPRSFIPLSDAHRARLDAALAG